MRKASRLKYKPKTHTDEEITLYLLAGLHACTRCYGTGVYIYRTIQKINPSCGICDGKGWTKESYPYRVDAQTLAKYHARKWKTYETCGTPTYTY